MVFQRLHRSTKLVCLVGALMLTLVSIPGRAIEWQPYSFTTFEHGWPFVYLRRRAIEPHPVYFDPVVYSSRRDAISALPWWGIPWMNIDNWQIWDTGEYADGAVRWRFSGTAFLLDILLGIALLVGIVAAWETRCRGRKRIFSFNLRDMFAAVTMISLILGCSLYALREYRRELPLAKKGWSDPDSGFGVQDEVCVAPTFIRALAGDCLMPDFLWRVSTVWVYWDELEDPKDVCDELATFAYLRTISVDGYWEEGIHVPFSALRGLEHLQRIEIDNSQYPFDELDVRELATLTGLEEIAFWSLEEVPPEQISQLRTALPDCRIVDVFDVW
jgi:hypothetical protein